MKLLFISENLASQDFGGGLLSDLLLQAVSQDFPGPVDVFSIGKCGLAENFRVREFPVRRTRFGVALSNLVLLPRRLTFIGLVKMAVCLRKSHPSVIFVDSTSLGVFCLIARLLAPQAKIICFCHNVELDFEIQRLRKGQVQYIPSLVSSVFGEICSAKLADVLACLHKIDSDRFDSLYNRSADIICPVGLREPNTDVDFSDRQESDQRRTRVGFIGSAFYPNIEAASFIHKLAKKLTDVDFLIRGNGFDAFSEKLSLDNLSVQGRVECVEDFYRDVDVIICPIFSGAGMKVKVAEALSYGVPIVASGFALIGYEEALLCAGSSIEVCETEREYVKAIGAYGRGMRSKVNRSVFDEFYSLNALRKRMSVAWCAS